MEKTKLEEMKQMIQEEVQSIDNLKERVVFKELMEGVFLSLYETNLQMYEQLEHRIMDDLAYDMNRYLIQTGLVEREYFDPSHHFMGAMSEKDLKQREHTLSTIREAIESKGYYHLDTIFFQGDVLELEQQLKCEYHCVLYAENEQEVMVTLKQSKRYLDEIEQLYHLFMKNGIPWKTVNAAYVFKMFDIIIMEFPEDLQGEKIEKFSVAFEEITPFVFYDRIPVWNVKQLLLDGVGFPVACDDHENYEHRISLREYGNENAYLVEDKAGIQSVRQNKDFLLVTGTLPDTRTWNITMIQKGELKKIDRSSYPIMSNGRNDGFLERFQKRNGQLIKTNGELERFIQGFGLDRYVEYQGCQLEEEGKEETYSMNFFMVDEIRDRKGKRALTLLFKPIGTETWLLKDIASFIVSEVQELYPEYQCRGKLL